MGAQILDAKRSRRHRDGTRAGHTTAIDIVWRIADHYYVGTMERATIALLGAGSREWHQHGAAVVVATIGANIQIKVARELHQVELDLRDRLEIAGQHRLYNLIGRQALERGRHTRQHPAARQKLL